ncbi:MAG: ACP S-malonyltransferase [Treponema sp.]|jgi:[acyl-carrier-protein] S-malonyltransferase|nr:ACP S-malonyltransferase [Treponema sp.]
MVDLTGKKTIFLFPGQGVQFPGMGLDLIEKSVEAKKVFDTASAVLDRDMVSLVRDSNADTLKRSDISQISLSAVSLAAAAYLMEQGITPIACAGFSLGEYPALACAGVISLEDCFRLVDARGKAMQAAVDNIMQKADEPPGMAAIIGLTLSQVESCIEQWKTAGLEDLYPANINSSKQVVVSGSASSLVEAEKRFKEAGARRVRRLRVAGPFHSPMMKEAADTFALFIEKIHFNDPSIKIFSNVTGKQIQSGEEAKALALRHIVEPVRWTDEEASFTELEPDALIEADPGNILQGLWRDTGSAVPCYTMEQI